MEFYIYLQYKLSYNQDINTKHIEMNEINVKTILGVKTKNHYYAAHKLFHK